MATVTGSFNFMASASESSLYRNGRVLIDRDPDGNTRSSKGIELDQLDIDVTNARELEGRMTCEHNGFELLSEPFDAPDGFNFMDHADVVQHYYPACASIVAELTGARAYAFDHNIRSAQGKLKRDRIEGGQEVQGPAHVVHGDYTLRGARERIEQLAAPPAGNDTLMGFLDDGAALIAPEDLAQVEAGGRFAIINVWRSIADYPVETHPLALCDGQTVSPEDLVVFEIHYPNRIGENYFSKYTSRQQFYYYPQMTGDEALIIKQWDSRGRLAATDGRQTDVAEEPCTFSFHTAFEPADTPEDARDRWSIEVRCAVIYPT